MLTIPSVVSHTKSNVVAGTVKTVQLNGQKVTFKILTDPSVRQRNPGLYKKEEKFTISANAVLFLNRNGQVMYGKSKDIQQGDIVIKFWHQGI